MRIPGPKLRILFEGVKRRYNGRGRIYETARGSCIFYNSRGARIHSERALKWKCRPPEHLHILREPTPRSRNKCGTGDPSRVLRDFNAPPPNETVAEIFETFAETTFNNRPARRNRITPIKNTANFSHLYQQSRSRSSVFCKPASDSTESNLENPASTIRRFLAKRFQFGQYSYKSNEELLPQRATNYSYFPPAFPPFTPMLTRFLPRIVRVVRLYAPVIVISRETSAGIRGCGFLNSPATIEAC